MKSKKKNQNTAGKSSSVCSSTMEAIRNRRGFTLIELMVVIVILSILAVYVAPKLVGREEQAKQVKARVDIQGLETALKLYKLDNGSYPTTEQGLAALVERPNDPNIKNWRSGGYLDRLPKDPWDNVYQYLNPGQHGEIDIYTLGADGRPGGEGIDADRGNWSLDE